MHHGQARQTDSIDPALALDRLYCRYQRPQHRIPWVQWHSLVLVQAETYLGCGGDRDTLRCCAVFCALLAVEGCVPPVGQCRSKSQTCPSWQSPRQCRTAAAFFSCSLLHGSYMTINERIDGLLWAFRSPFRESH